MQDGVPALREFTAELQNAGGTTDEVANKQMESFSAQVRRLKETLKDMAITIGEEVAPVLERLVNKLQEFANDEETQTKLKGFIEGFKGSLELVVSGLEKLINILGMIPEPVMKVLGVFGGFLLVTGPVLGLVSAVSSLWGIISSGLSVLGGLTGGLGLAAGASGALSGALSGLVGVFGAVAGAISLPLVAIGLLIAAIVSLVFNVKGSRDKLVEIIKTIPEAFRWVYEKIKEKLTSIASTVFNKAKEIGLNIIRGIIDGLKSLPGKLKDALLNPVKKAVDKIKSLLGLHSPSKVFKEIGENIVKGYENGLSVAKDLTPKLPMPVLSPSVAVAGSKQANITITLNGVAIREDQDIDRLAEEIEERLGRKLKW